MGDAPRTFADVASVGRDAHRRLGRVVVFLEALFVLGLAGSVELDRIPPRPHLACSVHRAAVRSRYPHPYGDPPVAEWTTCAWEP